MIIEVILKEVKNKIKGFLSLDLVTGDPSQQDRSLRIEIEEELKNITKG